MLWPLGRAPVSARHSKAFTHSPIQSLFFTLEPRRERSHTIRHALTTESARSLLEVLDMSAPGPCRGHKQAAHTRFVRTCPHFFDPFCLHVPSTFMHWAVAIPNSLYLSIEFREYILAVIYTFSCRTSFLFPPPSSYLCVPLLLPLTLTTRVCLSTLFTRSSFCDCVLMIFHLQ
jgi:hypothetical protein